MLIFPLSNLYKRQNLLVNIEREFKLSQEKTHLTTGLASLEQEKINTPKSKVKKLYWINQSSCRIVSTPTHQFKEEGRFIFQNFTQNGSIVEISLIKGRIW